MKKKLYMLASILGAAATLFAGAGSASADGIRQVSPDEAEQLIRANAGNMRFVVMDIRTPGEYRGGHIPNAVLLDFHSPAFRDNLAALDRGKAYLIYCRSGNRSGRALGMMRELGFASVYELRGGIRAWLSSGRALAMQ